MSYETEKQRMGREPITVVELDMDYCQNTFSVAPCTATGAECYNTYKTCKDKPNYIKITKTYRFCQPRAGLPVDQDLHPAINGQVKTAPTKITPGKGLGLRASVTVEIKDFTDSDIGIDKYVSNRSYDPLTQGTFWGRFMARNPYYQGRTMRVRTGYISDPWDWSNFEDRIYFIEKIEGPIRKGDDVVYRITGKDMLKLLDDERAKVPAPSEGSLLADITSTDTSFTLDPAGIGANYPTSGTGRIGDELVTYTRSGDTVTITRAQWGTKADSHDAGDTFQDCLVYNAVNAVDILDDLLNRAGIDESYIPYDAGLSSPTGTNDEWDDEKATWISQTLTAVISEPTGVNTLVAELCNENQINIWWDEVQQKIKLKANVPTLANAAVTELDDNANFLAGSVRVKDDTNQRVSRALIYYDKVNQIDGKDAKNYRKLYIQADPNKESDNQYGDERATEIKSRWFSSANSGTVAGMAGRLLNRFGDTPKVINFSLDAKDSSLWTGDLCDVTTRYIQGTDGANRKTRFQVLSVRESEQGHRYDYEALYFVFSNRNAFIGPNTLLDYASESDANKEAYAFIAQSDGLMPDGEQGYLII
jgi:hypothetical protein